MTRIVRAALPKLLFVAASASAQVAPGVPVKPDTPSGPVTTAAVDPVARAMARAALADASAPTIIKTTIVGGETLTTPALVDTTGTVGNSLIQVAGSAPDNTGYLAFKFGDDSKGITNYWVKTRGPTMNTYGAVQAGDRIKVDMWQAGTGSQTGHAGGIWVTVDNDRYTAGEVAGRWMLMTGTGIHVSQAAPPYPQRYGSMAALVANSFQQVYFPGGATPFTAGPGRNFGGWVVIGAGAASPGFGALKFVTAGAALLATPEVGAFEVDADAKPYFTTADGIRRAVMLADTGAPSVSVLAGAGPGASASIDSSGTSGRVTLTTGAVAGTGASLFEVTYAHPYPAASYPVISAANAAAVGLVRGSYVTATASGFIVSLPPGTAAAASIYAITFNAPGR